MLFSKWPQSHITLKCFVCLSVFFVNISKERLKLAFLVVYVRGSIVSAFLTSKLFASVFTFFCCFAAHTPVVGVVTLHICLIFQPCQQNW